MATPSRPRTTIIIPACNAGATIDRTLASMVRQSDRDWEAIVIDDGSTDGTAAITARWSAADARIRCVGQPNRGAAAARNRGLAEARGEWTLFLDADDTIDRRYLARMHARLRATPSADAVCCGYVRRDAIGAVIARYPAPRLDRDPIGLCEAGPPTAIHAMLSRTALLRTLGGFDGGLVTNEDWDLWWRMAHAGTRFAVEPRLLADYHGTAASLTRNGAAMLADTLTMLARIGPGGALPAEPAMTALLWNGGCAIGSGGDGLGLPALVPGLAAPARTARAIGALAEGLMLGAGCTFSGLLPLWPQFAPRVTALLDRVGAACDDAAFAAAVARGIEREVIRVGRFRRAAPVGATLGLMLAPGHLWRGVPAALSCAAALAARGGGTVAQPPSMSAGISASAVAARIACLRIVMVLRAPNGLRDLS